MLLGKFKLIFISIQLHGNNIVIFSFQTALKTSPAIHEQKKLLERAKTGDLLKAKIQQRPDRQELERRHILETHESHIDPSLADKYRMLEKAILVDQLNSKISHRPGPLELIEKNILHADEPIERIVKNGLVTFKSCLEDEALAAASNSSNFVPLEDDSTQSSEGDAQVQQQNVQVKQQIQQSQQIPQPQQQIIKTEPDEQMYHQIIKANMLETAAASAGIINIQVALPAHEIQTPIINFFQNVQSLQNSQQNVQIVHNVPPPPPLPIKTETITYHIKQIQPLSQNIIHAQQLPKVEPIKSAFIPMETKHQTMHQNIHSPGSVSSMSPASSIASPGPILPNKNSIASFLQSNQKYSAPGKDKNRKKSKSKPMSKLRAIKFHEYKGPPNSKGGTSCSSAANGNPLKKTGETNYELILQQQCLLEYLEGIYKPPHQIQPKMKVEMSEMEEQPQPQHQHTMKFHDSSGFTEKHNVIMNRVPAPNPVQKAQVTIFPSSAVSSTANSVTNNTVSSPCVSTTITDVAKLNKMKVSDLKAQLKKLNLPVSGPKPLLIERLKPFLPFETAAAQPSAATSNLVVSSSVPTASIEEETISSNNSHSSNISHELDNFNSSQHSQHSQHSVSSESDVDYMEVQNSPAPPTHYMQMPSNLSNISNSSNATNISNVSVTEEDIVREQQRKIEELQRQLQQSQLELEQMKQHQLPESEHGSPTNMQDVQEHDETPEPLQFTQKNVKLENSGIYSPSPTNFLPQDEPKNFLLFENNQFQMNTISTSQLNQINPLASMFVTSDVKVEPPKSAPKLVENVDRQSPKLLRIETPPRYEDAAKEKKLMMSHELQVMIINK